MKTILDNHIRLHINPVHLQTKTPENALFSGVWRPHMKHTLNKLDI